jgi:hypothetical protein
MLSKQLGASRAVFVILRRAPELELYIGIPQRMTV